jgi:hypothetical protein
MLGLHSELKSNCHQYEIKIFGPAYDFDKNKIFDDFKDKFKDLNNFTGSSKYLSYITYAGVAIVVALVIYLVYMITRSK